MLRRLFGARSSDRHHAFGVADKLLTLHEQYERLATSDEERQLAYRGLFATELDEKELGELRDIPDLFGSSKRCLGKCLN